MSAHGGDDRSPLVSVEQALEVILEGFSPLTDVEHVVLRDSLGRTLAADIISTIDVPPAANSGMDGYALHTDDLDHPEESQLPVSQRICAGDSAGVLQPGTAARIFTGAPVPAGANAVVMQEYCQRDGDQVLVRCEVRAGDHIRAAGEDINSGDMVLATGTRIRPQEIGVAASVGMSELPVSRRVRVAVLSTGDELVEPGTAITPGKIYNSNRHTLVGLLQALGCEPVDMGIVADDPAVVRDVLSSAARQGDLVLTTGGVSVGEEDYVRDIVAELGQIQLWRVAIKPGKPLAFGHVDGTPFIGLPGNPSSAFVTFCLFARPAILRMQGQKQVHPLSITARAGFDFHNNHSRRRREFLRGRLERDNSSTTVNLYPNQGSGVLRSTSWANGLAVIPEGKTIKRGDDIEFLMFNELMS